MSRTKRLVLAAAPVLIGAFLAIFGAIHITTLFPGVQSSSGKGSITSVTYRVEISYCLYPLWDPPNWNHVDYGATTCSASPAWHTPLNPPPACLFPPVLNTANYALNYVGVVLIAVGMAMVLRSSIRRGRRNAET